MRKAAAEGVIAAKEALPIVRELMLRDSKLRKATEDANDSANASESTFKTGGAVHSLESRQEITTEAAEEATMTIRGIEAARENGERNEGTALEKDPPSQHENKSHALKK